MRNASVKHQSRGSNLPSPAAERSWVDFVYPSRGSSVRVRLQNTLKRLAVDDNETDSQSKKGQDSFCGTFC